MTDKPLSKKVIKARHPLAIPILNDYFFSYDVRDAVKNLKKDVCCCRIYAGKMKCNPCKMINKHFGKELTEETK